MKISPNRHARSAARNRAETEKERERERESHTCIRIYLTLHVCVVCIYLASIRGSWKTLLEDEKALHVRVTHMVVCLNRGIRFRVGSWRVWGSDSDPKNKGCLPDRNGTPFDSPKPSCPFLDTLKTRCRIIIGTQKRDHNPDNHPCISQGYIVGSPK